MVLFYILIFWLGMPVAESIFPWGGVTQSYFKPIYLGLVAMSGLIAGCTCYITEVIKEVNSNQSLNTNDEK